MTAPVGRRRPSAPRVQAAPCNHFALWPTVLRTGTGEDLFDCLAGCKRRVTMAEAIDAAREDGRRVEAQLEAQRRAARHLRVVGDGERAGDG